MPFLEIDGIMLYDWVSLKYGFEVYWKPWSHCGAATPMWPFPFSWQPWLFPIQVVHSVLCLFCKQQCCCQTNPWMTERYNTPCSVCIYEISVTHFWFGLSALKSLLSRLIQFVKYYFPEAKSVCMFVLTRKNEKLPQKLAEVL